MAKTAETQTLNVQLDGDLMNALDKAVGLQGDTDRAKLTRKALKTRITQIFKEHGEPVPDLG